MVKQQDGKYYAHAEHETVQAMLHSLFRFQTAMQAQLVSNRFADEVILAPKMRDPKDRTAIFLWVRDLDVSDEQRSRGYLGNFAKISILKLPNGKWTLSMIRVDIPLVKHPMHQRVNRRYPNAGHPLIRAAERGKIFHSMEAAYPVLQDLHEEFPEVSIPGVGRLKIMMYRKAIKGETPVRKMELSVMKRAPEEYVIEIQEAAAKKMPPPSKDAIRRATQETPSPETEGFYATLVTKRRKRKKKV